MTEQRAPRGRTTWALAAVAGLILAAMGAALHRHGGPMFGAVATLDPALVAGALALCLAYRLVNAGGWGLILRALGEPVDAVPAARVWLASEACRWLPGSLWSFGSRAALAAARGVPGRVAGVSLVLELGVTVAAWVAVSALGVFDLRVPTSLIARVTPTAAWLALAIAALLAVAPWSALARRVRARVPALRHLAAARPDGPRLARAFGFYVAMALLNGATLVVLVRAAPAGSACPILGVVAANALAWLVGFFAIFAPGGLVVREAFLSGLLCAWMPPEQALAIALAWRLLQILAEIACFAAVALTGLPGSLRTEAGSDAELTAAPLGCGAGANG